MRARHVAGDGDAIGDYAASRTFVVAIMCICCCWRAGVVELVVQL